MKSPKRVGVEVTVKPIAKAKLPKVLESPSAKAGNAFRKTLPGKQR